MVYPSIYSSGVNPLHIIFLLLVFAIIYPLYLMRIHRLIRGWSVYSILFSLLLISNGLAIAYALPETLPTSLTATLLYITATMSMMVRRRNRVYIHMVCVEIYVLLLAIDIILYYLL